MKNKNYYIAGSGFIILAQSVSIWYAGKLRLDNERGKANFETALEKVETKTELKKKIPSKLPQKHDFQKLYKNATPTVVEKPQENVAKSEIKPEENAIKSETKPQEQIQVPENLYLVMSTKVWMESQKSTCLPQAQCVHFWKEEQLSHLMDQESGFYEHAYVILKVSTSKIEGKWIYKTRDETSEKYFHLYDGKIPRDAVFESKTILKGFF